LVFIKYKTIKKRKRKKRTNVQPRSRSLTMAIERTLSRRKKRRCKPLENLTDGSGMSQTQKDANV